MRVLTMVQQQNMVDGLAKDSQHLPYRKTASQFIEEVAVTAVSKIVGFFKGMWEHLETVVILTLSSWGLSALLGELPFYYLLPWWIEAPMVIPVFSVLFIYGLIKSAEHRAQVRMAVA